MIIMGFISNNNIIECVNGLDFIKWKGNEHFLQKNTKDAAYFGVLNHF